MARKGQETRAGKDLEKHSFESDSHVSRRNMIRCFVAWREGSIVLEQDTSP